MHEIKSCLRCGKDFECKAGNIGECQYFGFTMTDELKAYLEQRYNDCLCRSCLQYLQVELNLFKKKYLFR
jgi:Cysteine-rich CWC